MTNVNGITVNVTLNGEINVEKIAEAIRKEIERLGITVKPLKVGDYAKVIADNYFEDMPNHKLPLGTIVQIEVVDDDPEQKYEAKVVGNSEMDYFTVTDLVRATDEEVAQAKSEKVREQWAKINRKPNEFKVGDAVQYKKAFTTVGNVWADGVEINQGNNLGITIVVPAESLTLVFPAEAKFGA